MKSFLENIKLKIQNKLNPDQIFLIDNSNLHYKHQSFNPKKLHLKLVIKCEKLKCMNQIEAHKVIFSILKEEMNSKIHSLEIKIK